MKWGRRLFFVNRHSSVVFLVFLFVSLHARGYTWTDLPAKLSAVITDNGMTVDTIEAVSSITLLVPVGTRMAHIYVQRDTSINLGEDYEYMHGYCGYGYPWTFCRDKCCTHGLEGLDVDGCVEDHSSYAWSVLENGELEYLYGGMLTLESTMVESRKTDHRLLPGVHPFTMGFFHTWCIHKVDRPETCLRLDHAMGEATGTVTVVRMDTMEGPLDFKISDVRSWEDGWAEEHAGDQEPDSPRWLSLPIDEKCSTATFTAAPWPEGTWPLYEPNWNLWSGNGSLLVNPSDRATAHLSTDVPLSGSLRVSCGTSYLETTVYVVEVAGIQAVRLGRSDKPRDYWDGVYRIENWYSWQPFSGESGWENESGDGRFVVTEWGNGTMSCLAFPNPKLGTTLAEAAERLPDDWRFTGGADGGGGEGEGGEGEGGEGEGGEGGEGGEEEEEEEPEEVEIEPDGHDPEHRMIQNVDLALPGSYDLVAECGISRKALTIHVCGVCITPEAEEANVPDSFTPSWPPAPSAGTSAPFRNMEKKVAIRRNIAWDGAMSACIPVRLSPKNLAVLENLRYRDMGGQLQENTGRMELEASGQHFAIYDSPDALLPSTTLDNLPLGTDSIKYVRLAPAFFQGKSKTMTLTLRYTSSLAVFTDTLTIVATSCAPEMQSEGYVLVNDDNDDMGDFDANPSFPADVTADKNQTGELNEADDELMRIFFPKPPADTPGDDGSTGGGGDVTGVSVTVVGGNARLWRSAKKERTVQDSNTALLFSATECTGGCAVYVEGLSKGTDTVTATWTVGGRTVTATQPITILELRMIVDGCHPDANRSDMKFDDFGKEDSNHNKIMEDFGNYQSVFWVNDDCDYHNLVKFHVGLPYWCEQDVAPTLTTVTAPPRSRRRTVLRHDFRDDRIGSREACIGGANHCLRDLEDFNRLHILADPAFKNLVDAGKAQISMVFNGVNANLFEAVDVGRIDGLTDDDEDKRTKQAQKRKLALGRPEDIARHLIYQADTPTPFIWEGATAGDGTMELVARIHGKALGRRKVRLKLFSVFNFLDIWYHTDTDSDIKNRCSAIAAGGGKRYPSDAFSNGAGNDQPYILVVHGFNVSAQEKKDWAATVFKRLWWLGYRGRVGMFQWNCSELGLGVVVNYDVYDESDKKAWEAGQTLAKLLTELKDTGKCKVHVLAHSQGNVVTGSALRQLTGKKVETYIASQAAISLSCYKASTVEDCYHDKTDIDDVRSKYPGWGDSERPFLEGALTKVNNCHNYYNPVDYALDSAWFFSWKNNNEGRPDIYYWHNNDRAQTAPSGCQASHFYYETLSVVKDLFFPLDASPTAEPLADTYEIFTMASPAWLGPLGIECTENTEFRNFDLRGHGLEYNKKHYSHSRQFLSNFYKEQPYWKHVLIDCGLKQKQEDPTHEIEP